MKSFCRSEAIAVFSPNACSLLALLPEYLSAVQAAAAAADGGAGEALEATRQAQAGGSGGTQAETPSRSQEGVDEGTT